MAVDYEALALEMGGTIMPDIDYEALALEMGGTIMSADEVVAPQEFPGSAEFGSMESVAEIPGLDPNIGPEGQYVQQPPQRPEPTMEDTLKGIDETILAVGSGATLGAGAMVRATLSQLAKEILSKEFGTPEAAKRIEEAAMKNAAEYTYQPKGQEGPGMTQAVSEFAGRYLAPLAGATGELAAAGQAARQAGPILPTTFAGAPGGMGVRPGPEAPGPQGGMGVRSAPRPEEMTIPQQLAATRQRSTSAKAAKLAEEPYNIENASVVIQGPKGSEQIIPDQLAENYIRQGGRPGIVAAIKAGSDADRRAGLQMMDLYKAIQSNEEKRALLRPTDVIGRTIDERVKFLVDSQNKSGQEIDRIADDVMKKQPVNYWPAISDFEAALDKLGIKTMDITRGGVKQRVVSLRGSDVEGDAGARIILNTVLRRMFDTDAPKTAFDVHRLKRYLDTQINYGPRRANALTAQAERVIKDLRRGLNSALGKQFPEYAAANAQYADSIGALNDFQKAIGSQIDLESENADKSLGTASRKLLSNYSSRVSLMDSLDLMEQVASSYGLNIKDSVINQVIVANEIDRMFGTTADTSLKGIMQNVERGVDIARSDSLTAGLKIAQEAYDKSRGINEENAIAALEELLRRQTELNVYERPTQ